MNTRHLEEYLLFAEEMNFSVAAEKLYITRPTLVDHIRALETDLECKLVTSGQNHVELTAAGRRFIQTARDLLAAWNEARVEYRTLANNLLTVTIASSNLPWLESILYKARRTIHERYPYKRIEIEAVNGTFASLEALDDPGNDIVVAGFKTYRCDGDTPPIPNDLCGFLLRTEEIKLLIAQDHPLFTKPRICTRDLDGTVFMLPPDIHRSWTRDGMADRFAQLGARVTLRTGDFKDHTEYFTHEFGAQVGIVPTTLAPRYGIGTREEFRAFGLDDWTIATNFYAVVKRSFTASENGGLLFEEMRKIAAGKD